MLTDATTTFANKKSVVLAAGTHLVGDVMDMTVARNLATARPVYFQVRASDDIVTGGVAGTIKFALASDAQAAIATDGTASVHFETPAYVTGNATATKLKKGTVIAQVALPFETISQEYQRYLGVLVTVATQAVTGGTISAFLTMDPDFNKPAANAVI